MNYPVYNKPWNEDTVCQFHGGVLDGKVITVGELRKTGLISGYGEKWSGTNMLIRPFAILDGAPKVGGYIGPMADREDAPLRYETPEVYDSLSF